MAHETSPRPPLIRLPGTGVGTSNRWRTRQVSACAASLGVHGVLLALFLTLNVLAGPARPPSVDTEPTQIQAPLEDDDSQPIAIAPDIGGDARIDSNFNTNRLADHTVPGKLLPNEPIGDDNGQNDPHNVPLPPGFGNENQTRIGDPKIDGIGAAADALGMNVPQPRPGTGFPGRNAATREQNLKNGGGNHETEAAVSRGLIWLSKQQKPDGSWELDGNSRSKISGTGIALLPYLAAGYTHKSVVKDDYKKWAGRFPQQVEAGLKFLLSKQDRLGDFGGDTMYEQAIATMALCEAYGMTADKRLQAPAQLAVDFIQSAQNGAGGWRYMPGQAGDMSVTGWQVQALKSAFLAGLRVRRDVLSRASSFLDFCAGGTPVGSTYGYVNKNATPTMTAVGLLSRMYLGWGPKNPAMIAGIDVLKKLPPREDANDKRPMDIYYYYYATQVVYFYGGPEWHAFWNPRMRNWLLDLQVVGDGPKSGSWSPDATLTGSAGGRVLMTSLTLLTLEIYYRHLPLYQRQAGAQDLEGY